MLNCHWVEERGKRFWKHGTARRLLGPKKSKGCLETGGGLKKMERTDWRMMFEEDVLLLGRGLKKEKVKKIAKNR
jgi:hypothetical protein